MHEIKIRAKNVLEEFFSTQFMKITCVHFFNNMNIYFNFVHVIKKICSNDTCHFYKLS
jgi:hypothetical protein